MNKATESLHRHYQTLCLLSIVTSKIFSFTKVDKTERVLPIELLPSFRLRRRRIAHLLEAGSRKDDIFSTLSSHTIPRRLQTIGFVKNTCTLFAVVQQKSTREMLVLPDFPLETRDFEKERGERQFHHLTGK